MLLESNDHFKDKHVIIYWKCWGNFVFLSPAILMIFVKSFSESNFSIEVVSYLLACFFNEIHYACFCVYVRTASNLVHFVHQVQQMVQVLKFLILQLWKSLALPQKQSLASIMQTALNHTFSGIMRCSLCIGFFFLYHSMLNWAS